VVHLCMKHIGVHCSHIDLLDFYNFSGLPPSRSSLLKHWSYAQIMKINIYSWSLKYPEEYMTQKVKCCTLFLYEFLLKYFSYNIFNKTTCAIQLTNAIYLFVQEQFFHWVFGWSFNKACAYHGCNTPGVRLAFWHLHCISLSIICSYMSMKHMWCTSETYETC
jgi:hypothetical protein